MIRFLAVLVAALAPLAMSPAASASPALERPYTSAAPAAVTESMQIAAAGDIACEPPYSPTATTCQHSGTAAMISRSGVDAVLTLGDNQYEEGRLYDFQRSYDPTWGAFKAKTRPTPGNHEYKTAGADGYYDYFGSAAHRRTSGYYAYNVGAWRMYALNTNCDKINCAAELEWLRQDLAANPRRCSLAYMHHPRFSSGSHGDSKLWAGKFWPVLDQRQVDVALAGHDHDYERFAPMSAGGSVSSQGIQSWVVGTGGKELRPFASQHLGSRVRSSVRAGVLFMTLGQQDYSWRYRTVDGVLRDSGAATCVA
jgi:hypothetical protein